MGRRIDRGIGTYRESEHKTWCSWSSGRCEGRGLGSSIGVLIISSGLFGFRRYPNEMKSKKETLHKEPSGRTTQWPARHRRSFCRRSPRLPC